MRARSQPAVDVRPSGFGGSAACHDSDVTTLDPEEFLVLAADLRHDGFRLARWRNVVALGDHGQQIGMDATEIHALASNHKLAAHQLVIAIKIHDELAEGASGQRDIV